MRTDALMPDQSHGPLGERMADPWSAIPFTRRSRRSFVALIDGRIAGLIDLVTDPENHRWVLSRVLTSRLVAGDRAQNLRNAVWRELALQAIRAAGASRSKRIHAVLDESSPVVAVLEETGFTAYAQDTVLMARGLPDSQPPGIVRRQEPSDVWAIHQLYHQVTPRPVQYAEALTSNFWGGSVPGQTTARGFVVEHGIEIVAHCRVTKGCDGPVLHVMAQPELLELVPAVLIDVVNDIHASSRQTITVIIPDYLQEYIGPIEQLGFTPTGRQTRLVKYTVVAQRMQFRSVEDLAREIPERVAAGSPTLTYAPAVDRDKKTIDSDTSSDYGIR
jgi:hypothetical protein